MKKIFLLPLTAVLLPLGLTSCPENRKDNSARAQETRDIERTMQQQRTELGLPNIVNFYEKRMLKTIIEMRDDSTLINHLYTRNAMTGKWVYEGKCVGFGIPYATRYSQPEATDERRSHVNGGIAATTLSLPEANGLYPTPSTSATWIIKVAEDGSTFVDYIEPEIRVSQSKIPARLVETWSLPEDY